MPVMFVYQKGQFCSGLCLNERKHVFRISDSVRFKQVWLSYTRDYYIMQEYYISQIVNKNALTRRRECAAWSAHLLLVVAESLISRRKNT